MGCSGKTLSIRDLLTRGHGRTHTHTPAVHVQQLAGKRAGTAARMPTCGMLLWFIAAGAAHLVALPEGGALELVCGCHEVVVD